MFLWYSKKAKGIQYVIFEYLQCFVNYKNAWIFFQKHSNPFTNAIVHPTTRATIFYTPLPHYTTLYDLLPYLSIVTDAATIKAISEHVTVDPGEDAILNCTVDGK